MTFDIPPDVYARISSIPDLGTRVEMFLRHEAELEILRKTRFGTEAREIAARAFQNAHSVQLKAEDVRASFETLRTQHQSVTEQL
jgi:hypothetical protein